jgi:hypothetical protein
MLVTRLWAIIEHNVTDLPSIITMFWHENSLIIRDIYSFTHKVLIRCLLNVFVLLIFYRLFMFCVFFCTWCRMYEWMGFVWMHSYGSFLYTQENDQEEVKCVYKHMKLCILFTQSVLVCKYKALSRSMTTLKDVYFSKKMLALSCSTQYTKVLIRTVNACWCCEKFIFKVSVYIVINICLGNSLWFSF